LAPLPQSPPPVLDNPAAGSARGQIGSGDPGGSFFGSVFGAVVDRVTTSVKPAVVAAVATTFSFPLALAVLVILFLLVQARMDSRDPKLRHAPRTTWESYIPFKDEDR
jgi:hypothetical protein